MHGKTIAAWPETYSNYDANMLIATFAAGPARLRESIKGLSEDHLSARPRLGKWSIKEVVAHVTDSEIQGIFRFRMVWAQPGNIWPVFNQDIWAREHEHQSLSAEELENSINLFEALRKATTPLLRKATAEDWEKHGVHPEMGPVTLRGLLELYADHSERHIDQILTMRTMLGVPIDMPLLLEKRLL